MVSGVPSRVVFGVMEVKLPLDRHCERAVIRLSRGPEDVKDLQSGPFGMGSFFCRPKTDEDSRHYGSDYRTDPLINVPPFWEEQFKPTPI